MTMSEQDWMDRCEHAEYDLDEAGTKIADLEHEIAVLTRALLHATENMSPMCINCSEKCECGSDECIEYCTTYARAELEKEAKDKEFESIVELLTK